MSQAASSWEARRGRCKGKDHQPLTSREAFRAGEEQALPSALHASCTQEFQTAECKSGAKCQRELFMIDVSSLSFWHYFKHSWQRNVPECNLC